MNIFGERLKMAMEEMHLNAPQMAKFLEIPQQSLWRYINEDRSPSGDKITHISKKLKKSCDWLLGVDAEKDVPSQAASPPPPQSGVTISNESVERLILQNTKLSNAAEALGESHRAANKTISDLANTNAELAKELLAVVKETRQTKGCTPAESAHSGGGRATKHAASG